LTWWPAHNKKGAKKCVQLKQAAAALHRWQTTFSLNQTWLNRFAGVYTPYIFHNK
jgi:hypothetical protein